jgi:hypothetical protein
LIAGRAGRGGPRKADEADGGRGTQAGGGGGGGDEAGGDRCPGAAGGIAGEGAEVADGAGGQAADRAAEIADRSCAEVEAADPVRGRGAAVAGAVIDRGRGGGAAGGSEGAVERGGAAGDGGGGEVREDRREGGGVGRGGGDADEGRLWMFSYTARTQAAAAFHVGDAKLVERALEPAGRVLAAEADGPGGECFAGRGAAGGHFRAVEVEAGGGAVVDRGEVVPLVVGEVGGAGDVDAGAAFPPEAAGAGDGEPPVAGAVVGFLGEERAVVAGCGFVGGGELEPAGEFVVVREIEFVRVGDDRVLGGAVVDESGGDLASTW